MSRSFDLVVIGGGPGGYVAALRASQLGLSVACIEKRSTFGGTCLNVGCIPSKALLDSSELYHVTSHKLAKHGISVSKVSLDLAALMKRKEEVVKSLTSGIAGLFKKNKVTPIHGTGKVLASSQVEVSNENGKEILTAKNILLATGSEITELPHLKFDHKFIVNSTDALSFTEVPEHLVVVGAGYIGLELGSVWSRLGSKVTVVEALPRILPPCDAEIAALVHKSLEKQGLKIHLNTKVESATVSGKKVTLKATGPDGPLNFTADKVLVAVGRKPNIEGLGLKEAGIHYDEKTLKVTVDSNFQTNLPHVYAIGDIIAGPMLAHKAQEEGVAVAEHLVGKPVHFHYDSIPSVIYIWPEVASVGPTEEQLKESGRAYKVGKFPFIASGRAKCMDEAEGIVKVLTDPKTDRVLAVHIFGPRASDMIAEAVTIVEFKGSAEDIARITHAHPTLSESLAEAARHASFGMPLHA